MVSNADTEVKSDPALTHQQVVNEITQVVDVSGEPPYSAAAGFRLTYELMLGPRDFDLMWLGLELLVLARPEDDDAVTVLQQQMMEVQHRVETAQAAYDKRKEDQ